jgi:hypothetical protein
MNIFLTVARRKEPWALDGLCVCVQKKRNCTRVDMASSPDRPRATRGEVRHTFLWSAGGRQDGKQEGGQREEPRENDDATQVIHARVTTTIPLLPGALAALHVMSWECERSRKAREVSVERRTRDI